MRANKIVEDGVKHIKAGPNETWEQAYDRTKKYVYAQAAEALGSRVVRMGVFHVLAMPERRAI